MAVWINNEDTKIQYHDHVSQFKPSKETFHHSQQGKSKNYRFQYQWKEIPGSSPGGEKEF